MEGEGERVHSSGSGSGESGERVEVLEGVVREERVKAEILS